MLEVPYYMVEHYMLAYVFLMTSLVWNTTTQNVCRGG
jgi:hypothetical protein